MRLVRSSEPGAVEHDAALSLLAERAVLTRSVCRELAEAEKSYVTRRTQAALWGLLRWIGTNLPHSVRIEPRAGDGIDQMIQPSGSEGLVAEIRAGASVCSAFFMLLTADTKLQADQDTVTLRSELDDYWSKHSAPAAAPDR